MRNIRKHKKNTEVHVRKMIKHNRGEKHSPKTKEDGHKEDKMHNVHRK